MHLRGMLRTLPDLDGALLSARHQQHVGERVLHVWHVDRERIDELGVAVPLRYKSAVLRLCVRLCVRVRMRVRAVYVCAHFLELESVEAP